MSRIFNWSWSWFMSISHKQDICGIICAVMTWLLILYAEFVVMVVIIWPSPYPVYSTINMIIFNMLAFLAYASHLRTMFSDPVRVRFEYFVVFYWKLTLCILECREPCPKEMPRKKWFSNWASRKAKYSSSARNAVVSNRNELTTVRCKSIFEYNQSIFYNELDIYFSLLLLLLLAVNVASEKWTIIARGMKSPK